MIRRQAIYLAGFGLRVEVYGAGYLHNVPRFTVMRDLKDGGGSISLTEDEVIALTEAFEELRKSFQKSQEAE